GRAARRAPAPTPAGTSARTPPGPSRPGSSTSMGEVGRELHERADLGAVEPAANPGELRGQLGGPVEVGDVDDVVAAEDLLRLGERAVGGEDLAVADPHRGRRLDALERVAGHVLLGVD